MKKKLHTYQCIMDFRSLDTGKRYKPEEKIKAPKEFGDKWVKLGVAKEIKESKPKTINE